jgi:hypothetical protein
MFDAKRKYYNQKSMKAFKAIFSHGHFIDKESKKRLVPVQGAEYIISAEDVAFKIEDIELKEDDVLNEKDKATWIEKKYGYGKYVKILKAGEQLFFRVGNSKQVEGDEDNQYIFVCNLLEDLYLYLVKGKKGEKAEDWRLAACKCQLENCLLGGLSLTSKVKSKSLNYLFSNTVQDYFRTQRTGSANAIKTFFLYTKGMKITFDGALNQRYDSIDKLRKQVAIKTK